MTEQLAGPWVMELSPAPEAVHVFHCLSRLPHCLYLDSALRHQALGRYSFVAANPIAFRSFPADGSDGLCFVSDQLQKFPNRVMEAAVRGMLPRNRLGRQMFKKLKVYAGPNHPHQAQQPKSIDFSKA